MALPATKNRVPSTRSKNSSTAPAASTGTNRAFRIDASHSPQTVSGMRKNVMPGRAQPDHRGDVVDGAHDGGGAVQIDRDHPQRLAPPRARPRAVDSVG